MAMVAYRDDNAVLGTCFVRRDYAPLRETILAEKSSLDICIEEDGEVYGCRISRNEPVSKLYEMEMKVVRFDFSQINTLHNDRQEAILNRLCVKLRERLESEKVYWNIRLPSHIVDLVRAIQGCGCPLYFCGGTMELVHISDIPFTPHPSLKVFDVDQAYADAHREKICAIAYESFNGYQGQYHVSPALSSKAGEIYRNWIDSAFDDCEPGSIISAELNGEVCGFLLVRSTPEALDGLLVAVGSAFRQAGAYKALLTHAIRRAHDTGRIFVGSTQFDNFISMGTLNSVGMRPFYGIYNYHFDHRGGETDAK